ncbi:MAG TPA: acyltransferase [Terrimicrobiaceae bacterium]|nr:acyltransferase [Terrimicrobiaceae bacterium]
MSESVLTDKKRDWRCIFVSIYDVLLIKINILLSSSWSRLSLCWQGCPVGRGFKTSGSCFFKARIPGSIIIGENVAFLAYWRTNRVGLGGPVLIHTLGHGIISVGDKSGASSVVISSRTRVAIGKNCKIGGNVRIFDHDFHSLDPAIRRTSEDQKNVRSKPVTIGDDVFIGTNATILKGVTIGDRAIIGAGVVLNYDVPQDGIVTWKRNAHELRIQGFPAANPQIRLEE